MKSKAIFLIILVLSFSIIKGVSADDIPDTDEFHDRDCKDAKQRLLEFAATFIAAGWEVLTIGWIPGVMYITFFFAKSYSDISEFRNGAAHFDECDDPEFEDAFTYSYDSENNRWDVIHRREFKVAIGVLVGILVIGVLVFVFSNGNSSPGGDGCNLANPIPSYGICPY